MADIYIFPQDYSLICESWDLNVRIVCGVDQSTLSSAINDSDGYILIDTLPNGPVIAAKGLRVASVPRPSTSEGSQSFYVASKLTKRGGLLLQYLPPRSNTSIHYHQRTREAFHLLFGGVDILTSNAGKLTLEVGKTAIIEPLITHQLRSAERGSLIMLEMVCEIDVVGMEDHFYVS